MPTDTVDEVLHNHNVVNFSRKRGPVDGRTSYEQDSQHGSKRHRHAEWPEAKKEIVLEEQTMSPARASRFQEASMNDRPSQKPPSMFTRHMNQHLSLTSDELMGSYHTEQDKPLPPNPSMYSLHQRLSRSPERKRASVPVTASTFSLDTQDDRGGIFKFGKSMASAFNPMNVWSKFKTGWGDAKKELVEEAEDAKKREMDAQMKKAEEAYAALKSAGKLGTQGSHVLNNAPVFTPGYTQMPKKDNQRDSGISMDTNLTSRTSQDTSKSSFLESSPRKSRRHGRTPSFHDLKKVASSISLHRRSASTSRSPEKEDMEWDAGIEQERAPRSRSRGNLLDGLGHEIIGSLRGSKSKNNLTDEYDDFGNRLSRKEVAKQTKLTKRVSDLEAKLDSARRELDRALATAPPVPTLPPTFERRALPRPERASGGFVPALPTVLSESLLLPPPDAIDSRIMDDAMTVATEDVIHHDAISTIGTEFDTKDEPLHESAGNTLYTHQNEQLLKGDIDTGSPPAKENVPNTPPRKKEAAGPAPTKTSSEDQTFFEDASSPQVDSAKKNGSAKKKKKRNSTGKSKADRSYRPGSETNDDEEWKVATKKPVKRKSDENLVPKESPKRAKTSKLPVPNESPRSKVKKDKVTKVLRKPVPNSKKDLPPTPLDTVIAERSSLELEAVPEDDEGGGSFSSVIPAKQGPPRKPTARATPAAFHAYRSPSADPTPAPSSSPIAAHSFGSPKRKRRTVTPNRARLAKKGRDQRSSSPPMSTGRLVNTTQPRQENEGPMIARPNGRDVPPMPNGRSLDNKSSFEWPEDCF